MDLRTGETDGISGVLFLVEDGDRVSAVIVAETEKSEGGEQQVEFQMGERFAVIQGGNLRHFKIWSRRNRTK